jgi:hypothetical protein
MRLTMLVIPNRHDHLEPGTMPVAEGEASR